MSRYSKCQHSILERSNSWAVRVAQWWEHSPNGPCSNPGVDAISCWFSSLPREISLRILRFSPLLKPTLPNSNSIWNARTRANEFSRTPKCFVGKQSTIYNFFLQSWPPVAPLTLWKQIPCAYSFRILWVVSELSLSMKNWTMKKI